MSKANKVVKSNKDSPYADHPPYKILPPQRAEAKKLGVEIEPSGNKLKKLDVYIERDYKDKETKKKFKRRYKIAEIGGYYADGVPYGDYHSYVDLPQDRYGREVDPEQRRRMYLRRHRHEKKETYFKPSKSDLEEHRERTGKNFTLIKVGTPSFYADKILW